MQNPSCTYLPQFFQLCGVLNRYIETNVNSNVLCYALQKHPHTSLDDGIENIIGGDFFFESLLDDVIQDIQQRLLQLF